MRVFFILIIISLFQSALAQDSIFDILDEQYITSISELPYSSGNPSVNWQQSGNIRGYVDIMGFRNLSREGEKYYIRGDPSSLAIVAGDAIGNPPGIFDSLEKSISLTQSGNNLIASLHVVLKWHTIYCDDKGCFINGIFINTATFQDIEEIPEAYPRIHSKTNIIEYNNTINPKTEITLSSGNVHIINYTYQNESIRHYLKSAIVEQTIKGVYFANVTPANIWSANTEHLHQINGKVIIQNTSSPEYQNLVVRASNLYEDQTISNHSITRDTYTIERSFNKLYIAVLSTASILIGMIYFTTRRIF